METNRRSVAAIWHAGLNSRTVFTRRQSTGRGEAQTPTRCAVPSVKKHTHARTHKPERTRTDTVRNPINRNFISRRRACRGIRRRCTYGGRFEKPLPFDIFETFSTIIGRTDCFGRVHDVLAPSTVIENFVASRSGE